MILSITNSNHPLVRRPLLLRHDLSNRPPEITSLPSSTFPIISIDNLKLIAKPRSHIHRSIDTLHDIRANLLPTSLIKVNLERVPNIELREIDSSLTALSCDIGGDGGVVVDDELAPDGHECGFEGWTLSGGGGTEVA